jgi:hypothetical protein
VGDKGKAAVNTTDALFVDDFLFDHGRLLIFGFYDLRTTIDSALSSSPSLQSPPGVGNRVNIDFCRVHLCNQRNQPKLSNWLKIHIDPRVHLCNRDVIGLFGS